MGRYISAIDVDNILPRIAGALEYEARKDSAELEDTKYYIEEAIELIRGCEVCVVEPVRHGKWIPCSERLPKAEDMYQIPEQRYLCQLEAYGERKFCVLSRLKGAVSPFWDWYGVAVHDFEVIAWMPLPEPYMDCGAKMDKDNCQNFYKGYCHKYEDGCFHQCMDKEEEHE